MNAKMIRFVHDLVEDFPVLESILKEHVEDNFGEGLPHLFVADVARFIVCLLGNVPSERKISSPDRNLVKQILDNLEENYVEAGSEIQELLSVSFLEHLPRSDEPGSEIRGMVGPTMREQLRVIG